MAQYRILYCRRIPLGVEARDPNGTVREHMPPRFQEAVDRHPRKGDAMFRWSAPQEREGSAEEVARAVVAELNAQWPDEILLGPPD